MKQHRLAFVGVGGIADVHYLSVRSMPERAQLVAVCDSRLEAVQRRAKEWQVPGYTSFEKLLDEVEVDAVCLFLPHHLHAEFVEISAQHGKAVFLEKPIAGTLEHAQEIVEVVARYGMTLLVGNNGLFHPASERTVEFVRRGWLGRPLSGRGISAGWVTFSSWDFRLKKHDTGGGCWIDAGGHLVYLLREALGEADYVTGITANLSRREMEGEDHGLAVIRYKSGAVAELLVSYAQKFPGYRYAWPRNNTQKLEIYGDRGAIQYAALPEPCVKYFSELPEAMPEDWQGWLVYRPPEPFTAETTTVSSQQGLSTYEFGLNETRPRVGFVFQDVRLHGPRGQPKRMEITVRARATMPRRCSRRQQPARHQAIFTSSRP